MESQGDGACLLTYTRSPTLNLSGNLIIKWSLIISLSAKAGISLLVQGNICWPQDQEDLFHILDI